MMVILRFCHHAYMVSKSSYMLLLIHRAKTVGLFNIVPCRVKSAIPGRILQGIRACSWARRAYIR